MYEYAMNFLPPSVLPSGEEPMAAGGWQTFESGYENEFTTVRDAVG
jgi:hypothetical protein